MTPAELLHSKHARVVPFEPSVARRARRDVPAAPKLRSFHTEDEDAHITGMTRSLQRRAMALNFPVSAPAPDALRKSA